MTRRHLSNRTKIAAAVALLFLAASACSSDGNNSQSNSGNGGAGGNGSACAGIDCNGHGSCEETDGIATCVCEAGWVADGTSCVEDVAVGDTLVDLKLSEPAGVARNGAAVRSGVPFAQGVLKPADPIALFDGDARLPTQTRPLAVWPDGSVRWLLLETVASLPADATKTLTLRRLEMAVAPAAPVVLTESDDSIVVDTGPMQVSISKTQGSWLNEVTVDGSQLLAAAATSGTPDRGPFTNGAWAYRQQDSSTVLSGDPANTYLSYVSGSGMAATEFHRIEPWRFSATIEEQNDLRVVVRLSGAHLDEQGQTDGLYTSRLHFTRGARHIDAQHQWVYTGAGSLEPVQRYGLALPFASSERAAEGVTAETATLVHNSIDTYDRNGSAQQGEASPVVQATQGNLGIAMMLRDMAETHPKRLVADAQGIRAELYPADGDSWNLARYSNTLSGGETDGASVGAQGMGTGDFVRIRFTTSGFGKELMNEGRAFDAGPLQLWAPPQWYSDAQVMGTGPFVFDADPANEVHYRIDRILSLVEMWMRFNRDRFGWYGIENYGDIRGWFNGGANSAEWRVEGRYGWSGNSGEPSNQLWLQCLRTQTRPCFRDAVALAQHSMDQQMVHFGSELVRAETTYDGPGRTRPFAVGSLHRHGMQPFSGYAEQPEYSHVGGIETYYYLTGDGAARDALYEAAQFIYRYQTGDLLDTAAVNGVDVLSRAAAVEWDNPAAASRFESRVAEMLSRLAQPGTMTGLLVSRESLNFIRALRGVQYEVDRSDAPTAAAVVLAAADIVVDNADSWELLDKPLTLKLPATIVNHAVTVAGRHNSDPEPYRALAQRMLELASLSQDGSSHDALTLAMLQAMPTQLEDWRWEWDPGAPDSLLWAARQAAFRNDDMMGYHFYRNFEALSTAAAAIGPDTPGLTPQ